MALPAIDVGLMDEHLTTHEGIINKLKYYHSIVNHPDLKHIINLQIIVMQDHVRVMLGLLDPNRNQWITLSPIDLSDGHNQHIEKGNTSNTSLHKPIAIEARSTAKFMANSNFTSALMMKDPNVKHIHFEMAIQQATLERNYNDFIKKMGWEHPPKVTKETQVFTIQKHQHLL
ncbi:hypothetical protein PY093_15685 [Cytobacillus sp. S13-E01]|uniref:hypothetical protein n=1 Tax=Cytobacillus sp. S13-E01 TaxID=3031326 RepID=UPI0023D7BD62|nr:hypothetical protein [Cytobacillus sp. S13-E01]MDF0728111.1 hypothetical protein [Cytobacillus sp. S13-E01]